MVRERPTLGAVAARAGVSLKTASRALNGEYGVAAETARRVEDAARALGFRPNSLARSLAAGGPSAAVGLAIPSVADPFIAAVVGAVEEILAPRGLSLLTASHHDDPALQESIVHLFVERRVDALLLIPAPGDAGYLSAEIAHGLVVVSLDRPLEGADADCVIVDNRAGAAAAVDHLAALGHRRIAIASSNDAIWTLRERHAGYLGALQAHGIEPDETLIGMDCADEARTDAFVAQATEGRRPATAFYCSQPATGRWLMRALQRREMDADLAMFDEFVDTDLLAMRPRIVIASGPHRIGHLGATIALDRLDDEQPTRPPTRRLVLDPLVLDPLHGYVATEPSESLRALRPTPTQAKART